MADEKEFVLTREGKLELENELDTLKNVTRKEVSEKIKEARSFGDLSENAEYDEAKNEQAEVEARINEIEYMLKYARVIDDEEIKSDVVTPGSKVVLAIFGGDLSENAEYDKANEPSELFKISTRVGGCFFIIIGIACLIFL